MIYYVLFILVAQPTWSRPSSEDLSVVSVYTTIPSNTAENRQYDVYRQIANNLAAKLASPLYNLLGILPNMTAARPFEHIPLHNGTTTQRPYQKFENNYQSEETTRDREEVTPQPNHKQTDKKPEKIILYSSYHTSTDKSNDTGEFEDDDSILKQNDDSKPRGVVTYFFEFMGSILQLLWGGLLASFASSRDNSTA